MISRKLTLYLILLPLLCIFPVAAATVSIQVVQIDTVHSDITESSYIIEDGILDEMFNQGHIVSTSPIIIGKNNENSGLEKALKEAKEGRADLLAYIKIFFNTENSLAPDEIRLSNIDKALWSIYKVSSGKIIDSGFIKPKKITQRNDTERGIAEFSKDIANEIGKAINK